MNSNDWSLNKNQSFSTEYLAILLTLKNYLTKANNMANR